MRHLGDPSLRPRRLLRFELACLRELGLMPALDAVRPLRRAGRRRRGEAVAFGLATGGVLCPACRPGQPHVATLSGRTLEAIRVLASPGGAWRELDARAPRPAWRRSGRPSARSSVTSWAVARGSGPIWECEPMDLVPGSSVANRVVRLVPDTRTVRPRLGPRPGLAPVAGCAWPLALAALAGCQGCRQRPDRPVAAGSRPIARERTDRGRARPTRPQASWPAGSTPRTNPRLRPRRRSNPLDPGPRLRRLEADAQAQDQPRGREAELDAAEQLFQQGKLAEAEAAFAKIAKNRKGPPWGEKAPVLPGRDQYQRRKYVDAHDSFEKLCRRLPRHRVPRQAGQPRVRHRPDLAGPGRSQGQARAASCPGTRASPASSR